MLPLPSINSGFSFSSKPARAVDPAVEAAISDMHQQLGVSRGSGFKPGTGTQLATPMASFTPILKDDGETGETQPPPKPDVAQGPTQGQSAPSEATPPPSPN